jgi:signal transduction histidine kinase
VLAQIDRVRISQAVTNLVSNALKYGSQKPIEVRVSSDKKIVRIVVADHGLGIATKDQARIFERFERAVSHYHISGLGLGLYITREIARAHDGRILLESTLEEGSTFTLEFPLRDQLSAKKGALKKPMPLLAPAYRN